jgi:hypothetical protein
LAVLRSAFENGEPDELNKFKAKTKVKIANDALRIIRLSADESTVVVALAGGHVHMYSISNLLANVSLYRFDMLCHRVTAIESPRANNMCVIELAREGYTGC